MISKFKFSMQFCFRMAFQFTLESASRPSAAYSRADTSDVEGSAGVHKPVGGNVQTACAKHAVEGSASVLDFGQKLVPGDGAGVWLVDSGFRAGSGSTDCASGGG